MIVVPDDEIYRVDEVFLGPERFRFPWRWTYRQYGVAVVTFLVTQAVERQLGIGVGIWPVLFGGLFTVWFVHFVHENINWDRGIKVALQELHLEVVGPREDTKMVRAVLTAGRARQANRRRQRALSDTYGTEAAEEDCEKPPSWLSQFKPKKRKRKSKKTDTQGSEQPYAESMKVPEYGGSRS